MSKQTDDKQGELLGIPYDWRPPTQERLEEARLADEADHRILVPKRFGWGYRLNFAELGRRLQGRR